MVKSKENLVGAYAFLMGVVLAIIFGLIPQSIGQESGLFYSTLVFIGLIVGFANSGDSNASTFLLASLSLVIVGALGNDPLIYIAKNNYVVSSLRSVLTSLLVLFVPATIIVALKTVFSISKV